MNESSWIDAASEAEVPDDDVIGLQVGEHNIALYKWTSALLNGSKNSFFCHV